MNTAAPCRRTARGFLRVFGPTERRTYPGGVRALVASYNGGA